MKTIKEGQVRKREILLADRVKELDEWLSGFQSKV